MPLLHVCFFILLFLGEPWEADVPASLTIFGSRELEVVEYIEEEAWVDQLLGRRPLAQDPVHVGF